MLKALIDGVMSLRGMYTAKNAATFKRHLTTFLTTMTMIIGLSAGFLWSVGKPWAEDMIRKTARTESMVSITEFNVLKDTVATTNSNVDKLGQTAKDTNETVDTLSKQTTKLTNDSAVLQQSTNQLQQSVNDLVKAQQQLAELIKQQQEAQETVDRALTRHEVQLGDIKESVTESQRDIKTLLMRPAMPLPPVLVNPGSGSLLQGQ